MELTLLECEYRLFPEKKMKRQSKGFCEYSNYKFIVKITFTTLDSYCFLLLYLPSCYTLILLLILFPLTVPSLMLYSYTPTHTVSSYYTLPHIILLYSYCILLMSTPNLPFYFTLLHYMLTLLYTPVLLT